MYPLKTNTTQMLQLMAACESQMRRSTCRPNSNRLSELICYHLESGGNRTRAKLALWAGLQMGLSEQTCVGIASACELIHNASLLHDDIQDRDTHRRGRASAWFQFDVNTAMCGGTLMLSAAFESLTLVHADVGQITAHVHLRTTDLIYGQVDDFTHHLSPVKLSDYMQIASQKSGSLLALPLELVMLAAQQPLAIMTARRAGECFAVAYQITDDLRDLASDLALGIFNVVPVIMSQGVPREEAIQEAIQLAQASLKQAAAFAAQLPNESGQELVGMSLQLSEILLGLMPIQCEQV